MVGTPELLKFVSLLLPMAWADINSGCPSWGCLSWGTFSLSAGVPSQNGVVKWSTMIDQTDKWQDFLSAQGCVSDQEAVVCTTKTGYVSIEPASGNQLWNYTNIMTSPYLPVMSIYGDIIGMDANKLICVEADGSPKQPIDIKVLQPAFSVMIGNDSILLLTSSQLDTAQIVTYGTDGVVDGAIPLAGSVEGVNGTFVPAGHPIIAGFRAYVVTEFVPHNSSLPEAAAVTGAQRLYAMDLLLQMAPRIKVAWYFNMKRKSTGHSHPRSRYHYPDEPEPIVTYFRNTVYINNPNYFEGHHQKHVNQPYPGTLWAVRDNGANGTLLFTASCMYGPMAVYDTYDNPVPNQEQADDDHILWILNRSPALINGHSTKNGSVVSSIDFFHLKVEVGMVTSRISITRQSQSSSKDILIFGASDEHQQALLLAIEAGTSSNSRLLWQTKLGNNSSDPDVTWQVAGQIVNVALPIPGNKKSRNDKSGWLLGLAAMVLENGENYSKTHIVGIF